MIVKCTLWTMSRYAVKMTVICDSVRRRVCSCEQLNSRAGVKTGVVVQVEGIAVSNTFAEEVVKLSRSRGVLDSKSGMEFLEAYGEVTRSNL